MKYVPTIITVLLLLWPLPVSASEAGLEWDILNQETVDLYHKGHYARAFKVARKALEIAENNVGPHHPDVPTRLNNLAVHYSKPAYVSRAAL